MAAIKIENLAKEYVIGGKPKPHETIREMLADLLSASYRRFRRLSGDLLGEEKFFALKDVSFEVQPGEVLGIIGRNGAGKSTLLKILSGITEPTAGRVELGGRTSSLLEVGTGFHQELTGRENIFLNGAILGMSKTDIRRKFDDIVAFSEVEKFLDTPVKHYSSGMYVRLAFAVAAHLEPEILIVDEVLAVGDAKFQQKCLGKMGDVARSGRTVLLVSHNMTAVQNLCGRAIWLDSGRVVMDGEARAVTAAYMESDATVTREQVWEDPATAPGNDRIRMHRVAIHHEGDGPEDMPTVGTPIRLVFEFWNYSSGAQLNLSLVLYNIQDVCIFNSFSETRPFPEGLIRGMCLIPGNLLNDAKYRVRLLIVEDTSVPLVDIDRLAYFEVFETDRPGKWYGKWVGVVRPRLAWETEYLGPLKR